MKVVRRKRRSMSTTLPSCSSPFCGTTIVASHTMTIYCCWHMSCSSVWVTSTIRNCSSRVSSIDSDWVISLFTHRRPTRSVIWSPSYHELCPMYGTFSFDAWPSHRRWSLWNKKASYDGSTWPMCRSYICTHWWSRLFFFSPDWTRRTFDELLSPSCTVNSTGVSGPDITVTHCPGPWGPSPVPCTSTKRMRSTSR